MKDQDLSRLSRLTAIVTLLQSRRLITAGFLSQKFDISVRTVYRDIKALEAAGVPICVEEGRGYTLMEGYTLPPLMLTETEANALITAEQLVVKNKDVSFVKNYVDAIVKIKALLRYGTKDKAELLSQRVVFRQGNAEGSTSNYVSSLQLAITNLTVVQLNYESLEQNKITNRLIEPFALYSTQENWILIAWCRLRKEMRSFRLDRIRKMETTTEKFEPQPFTLQEYFEICRKKYLDTPDI